MRIKQPGLRTSLQHAYRCRTTSILRSRHGTTLAMVASTYACFVRQDANHPKWSLPRPFCLRARTLCPCPFAQKQARYQSGALPARDIEPEPGESQEAGSSRSSGVERAQKDIAGQWPEFQDRESSVQHDDISADCGEHVAISRHVEKGPRIHPVELLDARSLSRKIKCFLDGPDEKARVFTCTAFDCIFPKVATLLGLKYETPARDQNRTGYKSFLIKTDKTISAPNWPPSLEDIPDAYLTSGLLDGLFRDIEPAVGGPYMQVFLQHHWKVLMTACRGYVEAVPSLSVQDTPDSHPLHTDQTNEGHRKRHIVIKNDLYNVSVIRGFDLEPTSFQKALALGLLNYCQQIHKVSGTKSSVGLCFEDMKWQPAEFIGRAQRALAWGHITYLDERRTFPFTGTDSIGLWQCEIHIGTRGLVGEQVLWFTRKHARLLSTLHACAAFKPPLQVAYHSGTLLPSEYQRFAQYWAESVPGTEHVASAKQAIEQTELPPSDIYTVAVDRKTVTRMIDTLRRLRDIGFETTARWLSANETVEPKLHPYTETHDISSSSKLRYITSQKPQDTASETTPSSLPILQPTYASSIRQAVSSSDIIIIKAATGSGKTTQVPQIVLEQHFATAARSRCSIVCTQPRRVAAIAVARRVATERGGELGETVGYQVRFDNRSPRAPNGINYITSGYLLRTLEANPVDTLSRYTHIILDEVHERDIDTDLLLTALKNMFMHPISEVGRMPKVILMSATIDPGFFEQYFRNDQIQLKISSIEVPGRTFPVAVQMLEDVFPKVRERYQRGVEELSNDRAFTDYLQLQRNVGVQTQRSTNPLNTNQLDESIEVDNVSSDDGPEGNDEKLMNLHVPVRLLAFMVGDVLSTSKKGDILVFLPGLSEIEHLERLLLGENVLDMDLADDRKYRIYKLHSALYETNYDVFKPLPTTCRRIVLATNIAETSITLPQVKYVIDTGMSRQSSYDQASQAGSFGTRWISKAEVAQRRGRAGRTQPGTYIAAFSQGQYDVMLDEPTPELLRSSLNQIVLRTQASKIFGLPNAVGNGADVQPGQILKFAPSAPEADNVIAAARQLRNLHALAEDGQPTPMGKILSSVPADPAAAKAILLGLIFRCLDPMIFIGTTRDDSPIMNHPEKTGAVANVRRELAGTSDDDKHADWRGFSMYDKARHSSNLDEAQTIKDGYFVRYDTYCDVAQTSRQVFEHLRPMLGRYSGSDEGYLSQQNLPRPLFPSTSADLNVNSEKEDLIKALVLSISGSRLGLWQTHNWRTALHKRILPAPRSVNHIAGRNRHVAKRLRREPGDVLAYGSLRVTPGDKYPWACDSSIVSPLTAILFAESLHLAGTETLVVNDWMRYRIRSDDSSPNMDATRVAKIIMEYRKALDRFFAHAMSTIALDPHKLKVVRRGTMSADDFNVFFREADHPLRKIMVDSVVDILAIDAQNRRKRADQRLEEHKLQTEELQKQDNNKSGNERAEKETVNQEPAGEEAALIEKFRTSRLVSSDMLGREPQQGQSISFAQL